MTQRRPPRGVLLPLALTSSLLLAGCGQASSAPATATRAASSSPTFVPSSEPPASDSPSPTDTTVSNDPIAPADDYTIPAGLSDDELGKALVERLSTWIMAGATPELVQRWLDAPGTDAKRDLLETVADENAIAATNSLFEDKWQDNPFLVSLNATALETNRNNLDLYVRTYNSQRSEDREPFSDTLTFDAVKSFQGLGGLPGDNALDVTLTQHNNADQNRVGTVFKPSMLARNGKQSVYSFKTEEVDGAGGAKVVRLKEFMDNTPGYMQ